MAADYIRAIRQVQESGPYLLGGWSMGGLVAFEMASTSETRAASRTRSFVRFDNALHGKIQTRE